jgi:hypothetical protein
MKRENDPALAVAMLLSNMTCTVRAVNDSRMELEVYTTVPKPH